MIDLRLELTGTSPLVCHSERLANPDDEIVVQIREITSKRKKTEEDRKEIARLEWWGGLYTYRGIPGPTIPGGNVRKCLINAGKATKEGTAVARALHLTEFHVPIIYDGPKDLDELCARDDFRLYCSVGVNSNRTMRCRPMFPVWRIGINARLVDNMLDLEALRRIVESAGVVEGLCDNRINGYGRFEGKVTRR